MASFIDRLFRRQGKAPMVEPIESEPAVISIPVIEAPPNYPPELMKAPPRIRSRPAHLKGKRRTPDEVEADRKAYVEARQAQAAIRHAYERKKVEALGVTHYVWLAGRGASSCATCRDRDGRTFSYNEPDGFQHPGMIECDGGDFCRCIAKADIPGWPD